MVDRAGFEVKETMDPVGRNKLSLSRAAGGHQADRHVCGAEGPPAAGGREEVVGHRQEPYVRCHNRQARESMSDSVGESLTWEKPRGLWPVRVLLPPPQRDCRTQELRNDGDNTEMDLRKKGPSF